MPIRFTCPNKTCGKIIVVKDEFAGRIGKCPGCQTSVKVPAAMPAFEVVEDEPASPPPPPKKKPAPVVIVEDTPPPKKKKPVTPQLMTGDPERYIKVAADSIGEIVNL